ncbi:hypothetical protein PAXINDRAFT_21416 [Paxillus involutus ATCC 200175]|uniref:Uncharacterized protein n=1 Tax=Paxillus involutus ATCC 200175 TaxID=664439 RepID=A0A0C9TDI9_PAXIN|nr:hypothetical protein PAXINDRAFT_21416 [Paxillus involutus ATCC 200175]
MDMVIGPEADIIFVPSLPPEVLGRPRGTWKISYEISAKKTEDDLPFGWNALQSTTHQQLAKILEMHHFVRHGAIDWRRDDTDAVEVWMVMLDLRRISPPGKLESTIVGLRAHYIPDALNVVTVVVGRSRHCPTPLAAALVPDVDLIHPEPPSNSYFIG